MIYIRRILNDLEISEVASLLPEVDFQDGVNTLELAPDATLNKTHEMKWCLNHAASCPNAKRIGDIVFQAIDRDAGFMENTCAQSSAFPIISRTEKGMYYRPHNDQAENGNYSTTVFLNPDTDYSGGSLRLMENGSITEHKLPVGWAITYDTGIAHEVSTVTGGHRDVAVFWTHSIYSDPRFRDIYGLIMQLTNRMEIPEFHPQSLEEYLADPSYIASTLLTEFKRKFPPDRH